MKAIKSLFLYLQIMTPYHFMQQLRIKGKLALLKRWIKGTNRYRAFILLLSVIIGIMVGVAASLMKTFVIFLKDFITSNMSSEQANPLFFLLPIAGILITIVIMRYLVRDDVGHGIPRILFVLTHKKGRMRKHKTFSSFIGGAVTSGFGGSAGLESPIISTGAAMGSYFSQILRLDFKTTALLISCGAAGAISSIFYTPIAAVIFGVEVLMLDLTTASIIPLLVTAITGATVANELMSKEAVFQFTIRDAVVVSDLPFLILLGIITGLLSVYINRVNHFIHNILSQEKNKIKLRVIGLVALGLIIYLFPPLYGEGYDVLKTIINEGPHKIMDLSIFQSLSTHYWAIIGFLFLIVLLKIITTTLTIETGGVGGIFAPSVFTGGVSGYIFASLANKLNPAWNLSKENFAIVGMAGVLGGVLHAPLTAIFFAAEITEGYTLMLPLMLVAAMSYTTNRLMDKHSIFTRQLAKQGELLTHHKDQVVLTLLSIKEVIETDLKPIHPDAKISDLIEVIKKSKRNLFPVVDKRNNFKGILSLEGKLREDVFDSTKFGNNIKDYMIQPMDFACTSDTMETVMAKFNSTSYYNMPVIDNGKYIGFVSRSNTFSAYRKILLEVSQD
jgi:CIC family chloride channel protein